MSPWTALAVAGLFTGALLLAAITHALLVWAPRLATEHAAYDRLFGQLRASRDQARAGRAARAAGMTTNPLPAGGHAPQHPRPPAGLLTGGALR